MSSSVRKVILVSGNPLFREGLVRVLRELEGFELVGIASSRDEAQALIERERPDVILVARDTSEVQTATGADLLKGSHGQVVELSVANSNMIVYSRKQVTRATVADLASALENAV